MIQLAGCLISDGPGKRRTLINCRIDRFLREIRSRVKALKEENVWMLATRRPDKTCWRRNTLGAQKPVGAQVRPKISEVGLKGIKEWKSLGRLHVIEVAADTDGMPVVAGRHVVHDFRARLPVKIRVAAIHANRKSVCQFEMWLCGNRGKIK